MFVQYHVLAKDGKRKKTRECCMCMIWMNINYHFLLLLPLNPQRDLVFAWLEPEAMALRKIILP